MLAEAASDPDPPPLLVATAAAPAIESWSTKVLAKTDDEATISGCIASQLGILLVGVTTIFDCSCDKLELSPNSSIISICCVFLDTSQLVVEVRLLSWLLPSFPSTDGTFPAKINNNEAAHIHSTEITKGIAKQ